MATATNNVSSPDAVLVLRIPGVAIAAGVALDIAIMASRSLFGVPFLGHGVAMVLVLPLVASMVWSPLGALYVLQRALRRRSISRWEWTCLAINVAGLLLWWSQPS